MRPDPVFSDDRRIDRLAAAAADGSRSAFASLVELVAPRIHALLRRGHGAADADDLVQETLVRAWTRLDRYDRRRPFMPWVLAVAHRVALAEGRAHRQRRHHEGRAAGGATRRDDPADAVDRRDGAARLWDLADAVLPTAQRTALWLRYGEQMTPAEIARVTGSTAVATRVRLFRARERLARAADDVRPEPTIPSRAPRRAAPHLAEALR